MLNQIRDYVQTQNKRVRQKCQFHPYIYFLLNISISIIHLHGNSKTRNIETAIDLRAMGVNLGLNKQTLRLGGRIILIE